MAALRPVRAGEAHQPLRDLVADEIRARIVDGVLEPGVRLVESRLADELGVSRIPVREALRALATEGFVTLIPRRGAIVSSLSEPEVIELFAVRAQLESMAAELAARHATADDVERMRAIVSESRRAQATGDTGRLTELNAAFHEQVVACAGNELLRTIMDRLRDRSKLVYRHSTSMVGPDESLREHAELLDAIAQGEPDLASSLARTHVDAAADRFRRSMVPAGQPESPRPPST